MVRFSGFGDLEDFVREVLCARADLDQQTPMVRHLLRRQGRLCAVEFTLVAPRAVRLSAIWDPRASRVLFYDQNLERFRVDSVTGLSIEHVPAEEASAPLASAWRGK
ncbi:hypothetical protein K2X85_02345 [bacterium]|nr:hypothetical protein [bacterium]